MTTPMDHWEQPARRNLNQRGVSGADADRLMAVVRARLQETGHQDPREDFGSPAEFAAAAAGAATHLEATGRPPHDESGPAEKLGRITPWWRTPQAETATEVISFALAVFISIDNWLDGKHWSSVFGWALVVWFGCSLVNRTRRKTPRRPR